MKKRVTIKTYKIVLVSVALLLCLIIGRLVYVCLGNNLDGVDLKNFADNRNTVTKTLRASRGTIYDANGDALAQNVNSYTLIAYLSASRTDNMEKPEHVVDKEMTAETLAPIIGMDAKDILKRLNKDAYQVEFGTSGKLNEIQKEKIEALNLPGIDFVVSTSRYYKMSSFASYIVGYAKTNEEGQINGELGIESYYNDDLSGKNGSTTYQQDAKGYKMANVPEYRTEAENGSDVYLTIDSSIQLIAENALKSLSDNYKMDWGLLSVMDVKTGAIVASATVPTFNPNDLSTITSYLNPLVSTSYEPGSTMKIFSFASAIDSGNYNGAETYKSGEIPVADVVIRDAKREGWGTISFDTGFAYSSNVAATMLALRMGSKTLSEYYDKLGFGKTTGIELSGEIAGDMEFTYQSELATASFGQGVTITPIQMMQALTTISNDGMLLKPYIVDKVVDQNGKIVYQGGRQEIGQVYKKETTDYMKNLMYDVVYNGLTKMWQPNNVTLIAKTGTAQIASPKGGYLSGEYNYVTSLAGMFPKEDPQYIIYIVTKKMQGPKTYLANALTKAVDEIASYAKIASTKEDSNLSYPPITLENYISGDVVEVVDKLKEKGLKVYVIGNGKYVTNQYPNKNSVVFSGNSVFLKTNSSEITLLDMTGFSMNDINIYSEFIGKKIKINGYGYVASQNVAVDTLITDDIEIEVNLE